MKQEDILEQLDQAEKVLVGLGEEFDGSVRLREIAVWQKGCKLLEEADLHWLLPAWNEYCSARLGEDMVGPALEKLAGLLQGKDFFLVSVSTGRAVCQAFEGGERLVTPCGGMLAKQCKDACGDSITPVTTEDGIAVDHFLKQLYQEGRLPDELPELGLCPRCGQSLVYNNIYAENYDEQGYLESWQRYTGWLQRTLNRRLFVLELGVGMQFPTVIRWPFEKAVIYNNKAFLCRINKKLYQLPEELSTKGCGISKNAIAWLAEL